ncbi:MAG: glutathione S-transferase [Gaiellales bacterium]
MVDAQLYFLPGAGSFAPHVLLEAAGLPHELVRVVRDDAGVPVEPAAYLAINPSGRVPTLIWPDGTVQTESAAICLAIAERSGRADLAPSVDDPERVGFLSRLVFLTNTVQVAILRARYPQRFADGDEARTAVAEHAQRELADLRVRCAAWYADGRAFARGEAFGADDAFLGMLIRWTRLTPEPWWDDSVLGGLYERFHAQPAVAAARAQELFEIRPPAGT